MRVWATDTNFLDRLRGVCTCLCVGAVQEAYISSEQLVGHCSLWPALRVARISLLAVSWYGNPPVRNTGWEDIVMTSDFILTGNTAYIVLRLG